ncbi:MAG: Putative oxidoreductase [uncultured Thermomicrobiales bacterium]|uniref:Oxidoreductase n=1 Tax=uncultured Thermomicrobiales bacterium TaxID=1645740 RepID=A0A6J4V0S4_9BACT|nr:MAG: Putative oxidoreductase [uncultured Thermomicrobiales bacterium]
MATISDEARAFLDNRHRFAVLATVNPDGTPQQTVMWFLLRGDQVVMNTKRGRRKDRNLLRDPRVSICVEDGYRYVTLAGRVTLVEDEATTQADIKELATRYHGPDRGEQMARDYFSRDARVSIYLDVDHVDARGLGEDE